MISDPQRYETKPSTGGSALERRGRINFADRVVHTPWRGVELLRLPPSAGYDRWSTDRLQDVIREAADAFDLIVIDDGLSSTESVLLASPRFLDNVIMVVESGQNGATSCRKGSKRSSEAGRSSPAPFSAA